MAVNPSCSVGGDKCSEPGGKLYRGWCWTHYRRWLRYGHPEGKAPRTLALESKSKVCAVDWCQEPAKTRGWCGGHYYRWLHHGNPEAGRPLVHTPSTCWAEGCEDLARCKGLCGKHYQKWRNYGDPLDSAPARAPRGCAVEGCEREHHAFGWCELHAKRWKKTGDPLLVAPRPERVARLSLLREAVAHSGEACLLWPFALNKQGYGTITYEGKRWLVHRLVLTLAVGDPPSSDLGACHVPIICHNPSCVSAAHLYWGTQEQNMADTLLDGTRNRGSRNGKAILSEDVIPLIRQSGAPDRALAMAFGVSYTTINQIRNYKRWQHVA